MKCCLFDLDGTLLNTVGDLADAVNHALTQKGYPLRTESEVRGFVGDGVENLLRRAAPKPLDEDTLSELMTLFKKYYAVHGCDKTAPYPGILKALRELNQRGIVCAIVSNKLDAATKQISAHYFGSLIRVSVGDQEGCKRKPAPDLIFKAMSELGVSPEDCLYFGDGDTDILAAKSAGITCFSVLWGFKSKAFLTAAGATNFLTHPSEILALISL